MTFVRNWDEMYLTYFFRSGAITPNIIISKKIWPKIKLPEDYINNENCYKDNFNKNNINQENITKN